MSAEATNEKPAFDELLTEIADYVTSERSDEESVYDTARWCLMDSLGCALLATTFLGCARVLGPVVPGAEMTDGTPVPGTLYRLDPVTTAFNIGASVRWLDFNDTWLASEWGHPSDNLGAILACADYMSRRSDGKHRAYTVRDVLASMIKAHEIQGVLALNHAFNRVGLDHVLLVRIASTAVAALLLGGSRDEVRNAVSNAWIDGGALRTYRHAPNTGSRKSWAAGDATSRGVRLALLALAGEMGYATALSARTWGFRDVLFRGQPITLARPLGGYVMDHVLFKLMPAEFHAQTAAEAAIALHPAVRDRVDHIARIRIETQESAMRIINKTGPLHNRADRDHCLQYIVAVALLHGELRPEHYDAEHAADPRIDRLRAKMHVEENAGYSRDYLDPQKRSIANAIRVTFDDGSHSERVEVHYPVGHKQRRAEAIPLLRRKLETNLAARLPRERCDAILAIGEAELDAMPVTLFLELFHMASRSA